MFVTINRPWFLNGIQFSDFSAKRKPQLIKNWHGALCHWTVENRIFEYNSTPSDCCEEIFFPFVIKQY